VSCTIAEDSVSADTYAAKREDVLEQPLRERLPGDLHWHGSFACLWISRRERDGLTIVRGDPAIGDRDSSRVPREILDDLLWSREGSADIDVPVLLTRRPAQHGGHENFEGNEEAPAVHPSVFSQSTAGHENGLRQAGMVNTTWKYDTGSR
jgi:hypothetical protein